MSFCHYMSVDLFIIGWLTFQNITDQYELKTDCAKTQ